MPTTKDAAATGTGAGQPTPNGNGKINGAVEGLAEGISGGIEGLTSLAREQASESFRLGEHALGVLRQQSIASIRSAEDLGVSLLSTLAEVTAPLTPRRPSVVPVGNVETMVKAGFDVTQQLLASQRRLAECAVDLFVVRRDDLSADQATVGTR